MYAKRGLTAAIFACNEGGIRVAPAPLDKAETARGVDGLRDAVAGRGGTGAGEGLDIVDVVVDVGVGVEEELSTLATNDEEAGVEDEEGSGSIEMTMRWKMAVLMKGGG